MARRLAVSNLRAATAAVRSLHRREALDETGELLAVLLVTTAELVDQVVAADSDVPAYARAQVMRAHGQVIGQLREAALVAADRAWEDLLEAASAPG